MSVINLNDKGSLKETYHIEISAEEEIQYKPGDSVGIMPKNKTDAVKKSIGIACNFSGRNYYV